MHIISRKKLNEFVQRYPESEGEDENHSLASLMEILGILIENYEQENVPEL